MSSLESALLFEFGCVAVVVPIDVVDARDFLFVLSTSGTVVDTLPMLLGEVARSVGAL